MTAQPPEPGLEGICPAVEEPIGLLMQARQLGWGARQGPGGHLGRGCGALGPGPSTPRHQSADDEDGGYAPHVWGIAWQTKLATPAGAICRFGCFNRGYAAASTEMRHGPPLALGRNERRIGRADPTALARSMLAAAARPDFLETGSPKWLKALPWLQHRRSPAPTSSGRRNSPESHLSSKGRTWLSPSRRARRAAARSTTRSPSSTRAATSPRSSGASSTRSCSGSNAC